MKTVTFFLAAVAVAVPFDQLIHHVEISSVQNWVNTDLVRTVTFGPDRLTLRTPLLPVGGTMQATELVWERAQ